MEKKKNFIIGLLVVIIIILLALVFVLLYKDKNKVTDNTVNKEDNIENQVEEVTTLDINSSEVQNLEKIYQLMFTSTCGYSPVKKIFINDNYLFKNVPNYAAIEMILKYEEKSDSVYEKNFSNEELSSIKSDYKVLFGDENELVLEEEFGICPIYFYKNGILSTSDGNCGCGEPLAPPEIIELSEKAEKGNNMIRIYKKIAFKFDDFKDDKYNDTSTHLSTSLATENSLFDVTGKKDDEIKKLFEDNLDKFNTYIVTYKQNSDNSYYIYSVEKEK